MSDDIDEWFNKIRKYFKMNSDKFDMDFFFLPQSQWDEEESDSNVPEEKKRKGFKISYHFEKGMDKPEVKYKGNVDPEKVKEHLKRLSQKSPKVRKMLSKGRKSKKPMDARELSLEPCESHQDDACVLEPYSEINESRDQYIIILEVPGITRDDVEVRINAEQNDVIFSARNEARHYEKVISFPDKLGAKKPKIAVNNGIATLKVKKESSNKLGFHI